MYHPNSIFNWFNISVLKGGDGGRKESLLVTVIMKVSYKKVYFIYSFTHSFIPLFIHSTNI